MALVGRVVRPHGNKGAVVVAPETDFGGERFTPGAVLFVERDGAIVPVHVTSGRPYAERWVVGFEESATMDAAEAMRGAELRVPAGELKPLEPGRYYVHDLIGCRVVTGSGELVGTVARVDEAGGPLLAIETARGEVWVPLNESMCRQVDIAGKVITIAPPPGLLEVNER